MTHHNLLLLLLLPLLPLLLHVSVTEAQHLRIGVIKVN